MYQNFFNPLIILKIISRSDSMSCLLPQSCMTHHPTPSQLSSFLSSFASLSHFPSSPAFCLFFPPTSRPPEKLAAGFQIPPAPASWESAALWFKQHNPRCPLFHTQTGSEDLIAEGGCCESVYFSVFHTTSEICLKKRKKAIKKTHFLWFTYFLGT